MKKVISGKIGWVKALTPTKNRHLIEIAVDSKKDLSKLKGKSVKITIS